MNERKIIQFNPELFKVQDKKARRSKSAGHSNTAKVLPKPKIIPKQNRSLKNSVLRMIRNKQQESYKQLFQGDAKPAVIQGPTSTFPPGFAKNKHVQTFNNDFEESLNFANNFITQHKTSLPTNNRTLKQNPSNLFGSSPDMMVNTVLPNDVFDNVFSQVSIPTTKSSIVLNKSLNPFIRPPPAFSGGSKPSSSFSLPSAPKWGCLKGGNLQTYRTFHNKTAKNYPTSSPQAFPSSIHSTHLPNNLPNPRAPQLQIGGGALQSPHMHELKTAAQNLEKMKNHSEKEKKIQRIPKLKYKKQKKTLKRTYVVGRSKYFSKIGVLISNKTIRNKTTEKIQLLKQVPMTDIRKFLIKRGFIKIGTPAPNDLLRKMYETVNLVCGEIQNHNPDNLLYNFLNDH